MLAQLIVSVFLACDTKIEDVETHVCSSMCGEGYDTTISVEQDVFLNYVNDGVFDNESCQLLCEDEGVSAVCCGFVEELETTVEVTCISNSCIAEGRRHESIAPLVLSGQSNTQIAWLLKTLHSEAASASAFLLLRRELINYSAPSSLIERCTNAAREEVEHARLIRKLVPNEPFPRIEIGELPNRTLLEFATENVVEGCVFEAFAAVLALWQSSNAPTQTLRDTFGRIANDEMGHAQLAYDIHEWVVSQLSDSEQRQVELAQEMALQRLLNEGVEYPDMLGYPDVDKLQQLKYQFANGFSQMVA